MRILQVSTADLGGGAEGVAWHLFQAYRRKGHESWLAVGLKRSDDNDVLAIPNNRYRGAWARAWIAAGDGLARAVGQRRGAGRLRRLLQIDIGQPRRLIGAWCGWEDFDFPAAWKLLDLPAHRPDVLHCHNLHGAWLPSRGYFDLRALAWLSDQVPVVLTLHDAWLLSGHCAHSFDCERWKIGCGQCPDLTIYPAVRRDATAENWQTKRKLYEKARLHIATPSRWLMDKVRQSMLTAAAVDYRVIPYGIDLQVFSPGDRSEARARLGLPRDSGILLFSANGIRKNIFKDYITMRAAIGRVAELARGRNVMFIALGEDAPPERIGAAEVRFVPHQKDFDVVARYYRAADVYVHAARVDTFPNSVLEALVCGTPVVATAVGGIPEQVDHGRTGFLMPQGDAEAMATAIARLLEDEHLQSAFGRQAAESARERFHLEREAGEYLTWYREIVESRSNAVSHAH